MPPVGQGSGIIGEDERNRRTKSCSFLERCSSWHLPYLCTFSTDILLEASSAWLSTTVDKPCDTIAYLNVGYGGSNGIDHAGKVAAECGTNREEECLVFPETRAST